MALTCLSAKAAVKPPDWRWQMVKNFTTSAPASVAFPYTDDKLVKQASVFYREHLALNEMYTKPPQNTAVPYARFVQRVLRRRQMLADKFPDINDAFVVYAEHEFLRSALEALLTTGEKADILAPVTGLREDVINVYAQLFYDLSTAGGHLSKVSFIAPNALTNGLTVNDHDQLWKMMALSFGLDGLMFLWQLTGFNETMMAKLKEMIKSQSAKNTVLALLARKPNNFNASDVVKDYANILTAMAAVEKDAPKGTNEETTKRLEGVLKAVTMTVASIKDVPETLDLNSPIQQRVLALKAPDSPVPIAEVVSDRDKRIQALKARAAELRAVKS
jgi:citrate synthase